MEKILKFKKFLSKLIFDFFNSVLLTIFAVFCYVNLLYLSNKYLFNFDTKELKIVSVCIGFSCMLYCINIVRNEK
jgi:hypothetical protein